MRGLIKRLRRSFGTSSEIANMRDRIEFLLNEIDRINESMRKKEPAIDAQRQTQSSFDYQWHEFNFGIAMADDEAYMKQSSSQVCTMTGLSADWFLGKKVVDVGCGAGRFSYGLLALGADVTACDQSPWALSRTEHLCQGYGDRLSTLKIDLLKWDSPGDYDLAFSFGVVHHTGDTYRAIRNIANKVSQGGKLFLMVYGTPVTDEDFRELNSYEALRRELRNMPFDKKKGVLLERFGPYLGHGWFDAVSPRINDLLCFGELEEFLTNEGFGNIRRTMTGRNHHVAAERLV